LAVLEYKIYSIDGFIRALFSDQTSEHKEKELAYVLGGDARKEYRNFVRYEHLLKSHQEHCHSSEETGDLAVSFLKSRDP